MVAQIVLGSPLAQHITPTPLGFSDSFFLIFHSLINDFKT